MAKDKSEKGDKADNWFARHKILTVILAIIVIVIAVQAAGGGDKSDKSDSSAKDSSASYSKSADSSKPEAKIGQAAKDGKFEFTVHSVKCGETQVGGQYLNKKAQGQFCRLDLSIKNIGDEAQTIDSSSQYLFNSKNQKYVADSEATIYASSSDSSASTWYDNINPGNTVKGDILFDVPKGVTPVTAELHDSAFSGGVKVNLKK